MLLTTSKIYNFKGEDSDTYVDVLRRALEVLDLEHAYGVYEYCKEAFQVEHSFAIVETEYIASFCEEIREVMKSEYVIVEFKEDIPIIGGELTIIAGDEPNTYRFEYKNDDILFSEELMDTIFTC